MVILDRPRRRSGLNARVVDGEAIVLDRQRELVHHLNSTATYIWERCDGNASVAEIADALTKEFEVAPEMALRDVGHTIESLGNLHLLEIVPEKGVYSESPSEEDQ